MVNPIIRDELARILPSGQSVGLRVEKELSLNHCHSVLRSPCLAIFFTIVDSTQGLEASYKLAEQEVARLIQEKGAGYFARDKHLVLIVPPDVSADLSEIEMIKADAHICRKLVCLVNGQPLSHQLENLPFWPSNTLDAPGLNLPGFDVLKALSSEGFDEDLIRDVYRHTPGVGRMVQNILAGTYKVEVSPSISVLPDGFQMDTVRSIRAGLEPSRRLTQIELQNFRGIRNLFVDLSANIVFIYGANGSGKTSIIDAIEWAVTGKVDRLTQAWPDDEKRQPDPIINLFSDVAYARAALTVSLDHLERQILRHGSLSQSELRQIDARSNVDDRDIIDEVVGTSAPDNERKLHIEHLRELFRSSHFLGQSTMRDFLERTKPKERFDSLSKMLGAEAFVFFRRKVDQIIEKLSSSLNSSRFEADESARLLETRQAEIDKQEREFADVSKAMSESESASDRATGIRNRLSILGLPLSEEQIRITSPSFSGGAIEAIATLAEEQVKAAVSQSNKRLSELRIVANNLRQQTDLDALAGIAADKIRAISSELDELTRQRNTLVETCKAYDASLAESKKSLAQVREKLGEYQWLLRNLQPWKRLLNEYKSLTEQIDRTAAARDTKEQEYNKLQTELRLLKDRSGQLDRARLALSQKHQSVRSLLTELPQSQNNTTRIEEIQRLIDTSNHELSECTRKLQDLERQRQEQSAALTTLQAHLGILEQSMTRKEALVEELRQYIDSSICPVCGHDHTSVDTLLSRLSSSVKVTSPQLTRLLEDRERIESEIVECNLQIEIASSTIGKMQATMKLLAEEQGKLNVEVRTFRQNIVALGFSWQEDLTLAFERIKQFLSDLEDTLSTEDVAEQYKEVAADLSNSENHLVTCKSELDELMNTLITEREHLREFQTELEGLERDGHNRSISLRESLDENDIQRVFEEGNQKAATYEKEIDDIQLNISRLEKQIAPLDNEISSKNVVIADQKAHIERADSARSTLKAELARLGLAGNISDEVLQQEIRKTENALREFDEVVNNIERLTAALRLDNLEKRLATLKKELEAIMTEAASKKLSAAKIQQWNDCLTRLRIAVQKQHADSVEDRLRALEPVINLLYNRLSTHPFLTKVNLKVSGRDNEQSVRFSLEPDKSVSTMTVALSAENRLSPGKFFSEAQINVLALSIFLAGATQQRWSNLRSICIDDPVQQMDDMNAYAFLELIRGLARDRQFVITTCDPRFYDLAREMFECLNDNGRSKFCAYRLSYDGKEKHALIMDSPKQSLH